MEAESQAAVALEAVKDAVERLPFEVLHRDEVAAGRLSEIVDVDHVGVLDQGRDPRLVEQHVDERLLACEVFVDQLDDYEFFEAGRTTLQGELDLCHPALPDLGNQLVAPEVGRPTARLPQ